MHTHPILSISIRSETNSSKHQQINGKKKKFAKNDLGQWNKPDKIMVGQWMKTTKMSKFIQMHTHPILSISIRSKTNSSNHQQINRKTKKIAKNDLGQWNKLDKVMVGQWMKTTKMSKFIQLHTHPIPSISIRRKTSYSKHQQINGKKKKICKIK
jgi:predicted PolB exonuclease-like 3'-5' exonuclease